MKNKKLLKISCLSVAMASMLGCVNQGGQDLASQVQRQQRQIEVLQNQLSAVQPANADTWSQVQQLQQEIAKLNGRLSDIEQATALGQGSPLASQVQKHDAALRIMSSQLAIKLPMLDEGMPMSTGNAATEPGMPPVTNGAETPVVTNTAVVPTTAIIPGTAVVPNSNTTSSDFAIDLYEDGINKFNTSQYEAALKNFEDFVKTYPRHELTSNAFFWQGECLYQMKKYTEAALAYQKVIENYPKSPKYQSSMLKQGISLIALGKKDAGLQRLRELTKNFPNTVEARRAQQVIAETK